MADILIRGGTVIDGSGAPAYAADVRVTAGLIAEIGRGLAPRAGETVHDASGCYVTPGFIEAHTHYDATMWWQPDLDPLPGNGATTIILGNCGFAAAPDVARQGRAAGDGEHLLVLRGHPDRSVPGECAVGLGEMVGVQGLADQQGQGAGELCDLRRPHRHPPRGDGARGLGARGHARGDRAHGGVARRRARRRRARALGQHARPRRQQPPDPDAGGRRRGIQRAVRRAGALPGGELPGDRGYRDAQDRPAIARAPGAPAEGTPDAHPDRRRAFPRWSSRRTSCRRWKHP